jgi:hypothetical protein
VDAYEALTLDALKQKLQHFPAGTVFRWCPQAYNPFDGFSPGQRDNMFQQLRTILRTRSITLEPYSQERCIARGTPLRS